MKEVGYNYQFKSSQHRVVKKERHIMITIACDKPGSIHYNFGISKTRHNCDLYETLAMNCYPV